MTTEAGVVGVAMNRSEKPEDPTQRPAEPQSRRDGVRPGRDAGEIPQKTDSPAVDATRAIAPATRRPITPASEMYFGDDGPMSEASERFGPLVLEIQTDTAPEDLAGKVIAHDAGLGDVGAGGVARLARKPGLTVSTAGRKRKSAKAPVMLAPNGVSLPASVDRDLARSHWAGGGALNAHDIFGAHPTSMSGVAGTRFTVWAPSALRVSVIGDFNDWHPTSHELPPDGAPGVWSGFIPGAGHGMLYKIRIQARDGRVLERADPYARCAETPPRTASVIWSLNYAWRDETWLAARKRAAVRDTGLAIYQAHLGSWMRRPEEGNRSLTYHEIAPRLARHAKGLGFTHVELLPIMEHPVSSPAGFETSGYFTPTGRYGTPEGLMHLIDTLHREGLGVILSWCPTGFSLNDGWLAQFDGSMVFEGDDPHMARHPDGRGGLFDLAKGPVRSFLLSSALYWLDVFHADGLRVCDMAPMLYRDHHRAPGQWTPNARGGSEHDEGIAFLRTLSDAVSLRAPGAVLLADDVTCYPGVTRATSIGGLGFTAKHDHRWMEDALRYFGRDPIHRSHHHDEVTRRGAYAGAEAFMLGLTHASASGASPWQRMFGDDAMKLAHLRCLLAWSFLQAGCGQVFMGTELGQATAWDPAKSLDWHRAIEPGRVGLSRLVTALNTVVRQDESLRGFAPAVGAFEWIDPGDRDRSLVSFVRRGGGTASPVVVIGNFTPVPRTACRFGVPEAGTWRAIFSSDAREFGGTGAKMVDIRSKPVACHDRANSITLDVPGLSVVALRRV